MKELVGDKHFLLDEMKSQCETIKSAREEKRKQVFSWIFIGHVC